MQPGMPAPKGAPAPQQGEPGGASKLVANIHSQMTELMDLLQQSPAADDQDKQQLAALIQGYQGFVEGLASAPGAQKAPPQAGLQPGAVPLEAGAADVRPAL